VGLQKNVEKVNSIPNGRPKLSLNFPEAWEVGSLIPVVWVATPEVVAEKVESWLYWCARHIADKANNFSESAETVWTIAHAKGIWRFFFALFSPLKTGRIRSGFEHSETVWSRRVKRHCYNDFCFRVPSLSFASCRLILFDAPCPTASSARLSDARGSGLNHRTTINRSGGPFAFWIHDRRLLAEGSARGERP